jgi:LytS/YehU family sensor histidine kinase
MAFCIMLATLIADEAVDRGAKRLRAYVWAVVAGSAVASAVQFLALRGVPVVGDTDVVGGVLAHVAQAVIVFLEYLLWAAIIVAFYSNRRADLLAVARMHAAQVQHAELQRRMLESQLQALQARVAPQFLFAVLLRMRELYDIDPAQGARLVDNLIVYLRAALPETRESKSPLERELKLVEAYLSLKQGKPGAALCVVAPPAVLRARVPSMILLPLVHHLLSAKRSPVQATSAIEISVRTELGVLRLVLSVCGTCAVDQDERGVLRDVRERLRALFGESAECQVASTLDGGRIILEIPLDVSV